MVEHHGWQLVSKVSFPDMCPNTSHGKPAASAQDVLSRVIRYDRISLRNACKTWRRLIPVRKLRVPLSSYNPTHGQTLQRILRSGMHLIVVVQVTAAIKTCAVSLVHLLAALRTGPELSCLTICLTGTSVSRQSLSARDFASPPPSQRRHEQQQEQRKQQKRMQKELIWAELVQALAACQQPLELQLRSKSLPLADLHSNLQGVLRRGCDAPQLALRLATARWLLPHHLAPLAPGRLSAFHCHYPLSVAELATLAQQHTGLRSIAAVVISAQPPEPVPGGLQTFLVALVADHAGRLLQAALDAVARLQQLEHLALELCDTAPVDTSQVVMAVLPAALAAQLATLSLHVHFCSDSSGNYDLRRGLVLQSSCDRLQSLSVDRVNVELAKGSKLDGLQHLEQTPYSVVALSEEASMPRAVYRAQAAAASASAAAAAGEGEGEEEGEGEGEEGSSDDGSYDQGDPDDYRLQLPLLPQVRRLVARCWESWMCSMRLRKRVQLCPGLQASGRRRLPAWCCVLLPRRPPSAPACNAGWLSFAAAARMGAPCRWSSVIV